MILNAIDTILTAIPEKPCRLNASGTILNAIPEKPCRPHLNVSLALSLPPDLLPHDHVPHPDLLPHARSRKNPYVW